MHYVYPANDLAVDIDDLELTIDVDTSGKICVTACPDGYYADHAHGYCRLCDCACGTCNGPTKLSCVTCKVGVTFMSNGMCVS
jgi:hypothetical protein